MSRYIDKDKLLDDLNWFAPAEYNTLISEVITKQPEADVVEVVRCKDCKHVIRAFVLNREDYFVCPKINADYRTLVDENFYCGYAERNI